MTSREHDVVVGHATLRLRESGDPSGQPIIHFHGTPGSRYELAWADDIVEAAGVRLLAFDRPGYGGSTQIPFSLTSVATMALEVADRFGLAEFWTTGWSGGGPFALATAAVARQRVPAVGIIAGAGPFQLIPEALGQLSNGDAAAEQLITIDSQAACDVFAQGFEMQPVLADAASLYQAFEPMLSESDRGLWAEHDEELLTDIREAMAQGPRGGGWDNVAWIGSWDFDPTTLECPVHLWYGTEDRMAPPFHAQWFEANLPHAQLTMFEGEGHLLAFVHLEHLLAELLDA